MSIDTVKNILEAYNMHCIIESVDAAIEDTKAGAKPIGLAYRGFTEYIPYTQLGIPLVIFVEVLEAVSRRLKSEFEKTYGFKYTQVK